MNAQHGIACDYVTLLYTYVMVRYKEQRESADANLSSLCKHIWERVMGDTWRRNIALSSAGHCLCIFLILATE